MALATSNRAQLAYKVESTFGTNPGGNGSLLRFTGESLAYAISTETSKEIRSDRQIADLIQTQASVSGDINFELSYKEYDALLQAALLGTWNTSFGTLGVSAVVPTSATFAASTLTAGAATSGGSAFTLLEKGQWVKIAGSSISGQNIVAQVSKSVSPTTTVLTFEGSPFTGATGNGGAAVTVSSQRLKNGSTERSFTVERGLLDVNQYFPYLGMSINKLSLDLQTGAIVTGAFGFIGSAGAARSGTTTLGTPTASATYDVMNAVNGVGNILENGAALSGTFINSLKLDLENGLRQRFAIGSLGSVGVGAGTLKVSGSMEVYLTDGTLYDKFINNTTSSLNFSVRDGSGNGYVFQLPRVEYSDAKVQAGGLDSDVMLSMPFTALVDTTLTNSTILIDRVGVAA